MFKIRKFEEYFGILESKQEEALGEVQKLLSEWNKKYSSKVTFTVNTTNITPDAKKILDGLVDLLNKIKEKYNGIPSLTITGHASWLRSSYDPNNNTHQRLVNINQNLSQGRANAVARYVKSKIKDIDLSFDGQGNSKMIATVKGKKTHVGLDDIEGLTGLNSRQSGDVFIHGPASQRVEINVSSEQKTDFGSVELEPRKPELPIKKPTADPVVPEIGSGGKYPTVVLHNFIVDVSASMWGYSRNKHKESIQAVNTATEIIKDISKRVKGKQSNIVSLFTFNTDLKVSNVYYKDMLQIQPKDIAAQIPKPSGKTNLTKCIYGSIKKFGDDLEKVGFLNKIVEAGDYAIITYVITDAQPNSLLKDLKSIVSKDAFKDIEEDHKGGKNKRQKKKIIKDLYSKVNTKMKNYEDKNYVIFLSENKDVADTFAKGVFSDPEIVLWDDEYLQDKMKETLNDISQELFND